MAPPGSVRGGGPSGCFEGKGSNEDTDNFACLICRTPYHRARLQVWNVSTSAVSRPLRCHGVQRGRTGPHRRGGKAYHSVVGRSISPVPVPDHSSKKTRPWMATTSTMGPHHARGGPPGRGVSSETSSSRIRNWDRGLERKVPLKEASRSDAEARNWLQIDPFLPLNIIFFNFFSLRARAGARKGRAATLPWQWPRIIFVLWAEVSPRHGKKRAGAGRPPAERKSDIAQSSPHASVSGSRGLARREAEQGDCPER